MTTLDAVRILFAAFLILWCSVDLMTSDKWRAVNGFVLATNIWTACDVLLDNLK